MPEEQKAQKFAGAVPCVGDLVLVPGEVYLSHGADDIEGGLTAIIEVGGSDGNYWIKTAVDPVARYAWDFLHERQEQLAKAYGDRSARQNPDYRPEFNEGWNSKPQD